MPIGVMTDNALVALGGILGGVLGKRLPENIKTGLNQIFGFCAMGIAINLVVKVTALGAVMLSIILGTLLGTVLKLESRVDSFFSGLNRKLLRSGNPDEEYMSSFTTLLILSCFSGTGIFGTMSEALTGDTTTIICKAILDFFTVMIFATRLGSFAAVIAVPQMIFLLCLYFCASLIQPLMTATIVGDFSAVGGIIELIVALRILRLSKAPAMNSLPALLVVFPISALWSSIF